MASGPRANREEKLNAAGWIARWRVRLGYPVAIVVLWLARPMPRTILLGGAIGLLGLWIRAYAAGYLHKQSVLTVTGPYAHTRNPLYLGSSFLALGAGVAMHSWPAAVILLIYFAVVYFVVMKREEEELRQQHKSAFEEFARSVPLFLPRLIPAKSSSASAGSFSWAQYRKNHEYEAAVGFLLLLGLMFIIWRLRLG
jgi:protein-S-isoprenylcysteine O-methyltransferase Ste14